MSFQCGVEAGCRDVGLNGFWCRRKHFWCGVADVIVVVVARTVSEVAGMRGPIGLDVRRRRDV